MVDIIKLPAFPETGFDPVVDQYLQALHRTVEALNKADVEEELEAIEEELLDRSVIGSTYRLKENQTIPAGETILQHRFELVEPASLMLFLNLSVQRDNVSGLGVPFNFEVFVNDVSIGDGSLTINNSKYFVGNFSFSTDIQSQCDVRIEQTSALDVFIQGSGKTAMQLLEIKE